MGIHGNATCVMNYDGATGWLVGEENRGLHAMFVMMNEARLGVGAAGPRAVRGRLSECRRYAKDRLQGRALTGREIQGPAGRPDHRASRRAAHADDHPRLQRGRPRAHYVDLDPERRRPALRQRGKERQAAEDHMGLLTPVIKGVLTDLGFANAVMAQQVFGGHGYIREWGMEQFVRDARIAMIYEGANGIQALDLVGRKLGKDGGRAVHGVLRRGAGLRDKEHEADAAMKPLVAAQAKALGDLQQATLWFMQNGADKPETAAAGATDYMHLFGLVALGYMWCRIAAAAHEKRAADSSGQMRAKLVTARFFMERMLPETAARLDRITSSAESVMELPADMF